MGKRRRGGSTRRSASGLSKRPPYELDLHGARVEEGLEILERFLDRAMLSEEREVRLIHGHGTGRLKKAVREYLAASPYVARFRPGDLFEGGDGVTMVTLR